MSGEAPLLESVRGLLQRTYRMRPGFSTLAPFVIGDRGYLALYDSSGVGHEAGSAAARGAKTLVRETREGVAVSIYFPDELIRTLESFPPQRGIGESNFEAFATFVEEIDHLLVIADRSRQRRPVSLFELELHADVSKYLVLARFLAGRKDRIEPIRRIWLRRRLFEGEIAQDADPLTRERYHDAARWAVRFIAGTEPLSRERRIDLLRAFHAANAAGKVELIERLAA